MKQRQSSVDLDEITPNQFVVNNQMVRSVLKGEGNFVGRMFELTTWRRDGLIARLREREFKVRTIEDQITELAGLPDSVPAIGPFGWRPLASEIDRYSIFDLDALRWLPLEPETHNNVQGVRVASGAVLRRRKGRGAATYHIALAERSGTIGLQPVTEIQSLIVGYAQALSYDDRPLFAQRRDAAMLLPNVDLPPTHQALLKRIAKTTDEGLLVEELAWPLAQGVFERLGMRLEPAQ